MGSYWNDDDENDYYDDDDNRNNESQAYKYSFNDGESSSLITPDTARFPPGDRLLGFPDGLGTIHNQKSDGKVHPSSQSSSRPCFGHREDSCTATNSSIKLPSIFSSRGSHNSSFLTTASSINGYGMGGGTEDTITADSSVVTSRDGSPFTFKREPTFFNMSQSRHDSLQSHSANDSSPPCSLLPHDVATRASAKLMLTANGLSPRQELTTECDDQESHSNITSTRSSHYNGYQHNLQHSQQHPYSQQQQQQQNQMQQQSQQSSALLLPISSTADLKNLSSTFLSQGAGGAGSGTGGKRKRKKNGPKSSSHGLGDPVSDAATERLLREKLGAIERWDHEGYSPTTESVHESGISMPSYDNYEFSDMNLIEKVKNETDERNGVNLGMRDRDNNMSGGGGAAGDGANAKPPVYQSTPSRIKTEKKVASVKA